MSALNAPTLAMVNDGTGTSATATIGSDAGAVNQLYYRKLSDAAWTAGETLTGPGTLQQTGLDPLTPYLFLAVSADPATGAFSLPSNVVSVMVMATATLIKDALGAAVAALLLPLVPASLSMVQRPISAGMPNSPGNLSCYILQGNLAPPEDAQMEAEGENIVVTSIQPYEITLFAVQSDSDTSPVDGVLNAMEAAVVAAVLDSQGSHHLCDAVPALDDLSLGSVWFDPSPIYFRDPRNASIFGQTKRLLIEFRHVQNSLFLPTS